MNDLLLDVLKGKVQSGHMSLATIQGGAIIEQADYELQRIFQNIADINTKLTKRTLSIKIGIKPIDDNRVSLDYDFEVEAKLAGPDKRVGRARIGVDANGKGFFGEDLDRKDQQQLPFDNVTNMQR